MGTKVPSERASCPRGMHCGAGEMGTDASWKSMENDQRCCAVCGESRMHGAKRGDEETYRKATRLVPTHRNLDPDLPCLIGQPITPKSSWERTKVGPNT